MSDFTILIVCTGNICRSPFAEALLRDRLTVERRDIEVHSAGTHAVVGSAIHGLAGEELARRGGSAELFRARQLVVDMLEAADLVLTMTREHRTWSLQEHPRALKRVFTMREFAALLRYVESAPTGSDPRSIVAAAAACRTNLAEVPGSALDIADPYGLGPSAYRTMGDEVSDAIDTIGGEFSRLLPR